MELNYMYCMRNYTPLSIIPAQPKQSANAGKLNNILCLMCWNKTMSRPTCLLSGNLPSNWTLLCFTTQLSDLITVTIQNRGLTFYQIFTWLQLCSISSKDSHPSTFNVLVSWVLHKKETVVQNYAYLCIMDWVHHKVKIVQNCATFA